MYEYLYDGESVRVRLGTWPNDMFEVMSRFSSAAPHVLPTSSMTQIEGLRNVQVVSKYPSLITLVEIRD
jgi:hypothetical protein